MRWKSPALFRKEILMMRAIGMACFAGLYLGMALASAQADSPNVVLIYIDDLGYSDVGFMGAPHYLTPQIDRLADSGMIFTNAYAAAPNCAP